MAEKDASEGLNRLKNGEYSHISVRYDKHQADIADDLEEIRIITNADEQYTLPVVDVDERSQFPRVLEIEISTGEIIVVQPGTVPSPTVIDIESV